MFHIERSVFAFPSNSNARTNEIRYGFTIFISIKTYDPQKIELGGVQSESREVRIDNF